MIRVTPDYEFSRSFSLHEYSMLLFLRLTLPYISLLIAHIAIPITHPISSTLPPSLLFLIFPLRVISGNDIEAEVAKSIGESISKLVNLSSLNLNLW